MTAPNRGGDERHVGERTGPADHTMAPAVRGQRLLFVLNDAPFFVSHRLPLAVAARDAGYEVHVAVPVIHPASVAEIERCGCVVHPLPLDRRAISLVGELRLLSALRRLYLDLRPDIVHHVTVKPVVIGSLARRLSGGGAVVNAVPGLGYLFLASGMKAAIRRWLVQHAYALALRAPETVSIFQNPDDLALFEQLGLVSPDTTVMIRGSGVDLERFCPTPEPQGVPLVVLPARMLWDKGVAEFVEAARMLRAQGRRVVCALVGGCDVNRSAVSEETLRGWHAEGVIEWWGNRDDMPAVIRRASIVCLPSYREGVPKVLLEGAASARAIVTTDVPGCREVVRHGVNGLLVPPRDATALAGAISELLEDPERRRAMGAAGRLRAEQEFSIQSVIAATLAIYNRLVGARVRR